MNKSHLVLLALLGSLLVTGKLCAASEIVPGQLYQGGAALKIAQLGLEFKLPSGWRALLPPSAEILVMEPEDQSARVFIMAEPDHDEASMSASMNESTTLDAGISIAPQGRAERDQGLYRQRYRMAGPNPQGLAISSLGILGSNKVALFAILLQAPEHGDKTPALEAFMRGVRFSALEQAVAGPAGQGEPVDWNSQLAGRTLRYLKTGNGYSVDKRLNLCSNGTVVYTNSDSYFSGGAVSNFSAYGNRDDVGQWNIGASRLTVKWNDGSRSSYALSRRYVEKWGEWGTFLDEDRWFNTANEVCQ